MDSYDVAIIGYGPTGAIAANLLGLYHIRTVVIEREAHIFPSPRAIVMDDEVLRILQYAGLIDEILPCTRAIAGEQFLNSKREVLFTASLQSYHTGYAPSNAFYQPQLEAVLRRGVQRFACIQVYIGYEVKELQPSKHGVIVTMYCHASQEQKQLQASYILGCDGAKSITRLAAGIHLQDLKFHQPWLVIDALLKDEETKGTRLQTHVVQQYCHATRPETYVPSAQSYRRWEFMLVKGEAPAQMLQAESIQALLASWIEPRQLTLIRAAIYTFHALIAQQWHKGRIFLLGDAAHQMPPFTGQGMCTGIRDAYNLCWKLALVLRGQTSPALLTSYQQEREPATRAHIRVAILLGKLIQARQPFAWLRDCIIPFLAHFRTFSLRMPPLTTGLLMQPSDGIFHWHRHSSYLLASAAGWLRHPSGQGTPLPQPLVHLSTGSSLLLDDLLGPNFAIIALNIDPRTYLTALELAFWDSLPTRFIQVFSPERKDTSQGSIEPHQTTCVVDSEGLLTAWFAQQTGHIAIVRPDRYIFGLCTPQTLSAATSRLSEVCLFINQAAYPKKS
jgi:3-(3-hydroxy-phenyl)propionate hydroxylase